MRRLAALGFATTVAAASPAGAATVFVEVWKVDSTISGDVRPSSVPTGAPDVTFRSGGAVDINGGGGDTVAFLLGETGAGTFTDIAGNAAITSDTTFWRFTGFLSVTRGDSFTIVHDDGIDLRVNGLSVIAFPDVTSPRPTTGTYAGPSGVVPFTLLYGQRFGETVLAFSLPVAGAPPAGVPAPAGAALFGFALLGLAAAARRRA